RLPGSPPSSASPAGDCPSRTPKRPPTRSRSRCDLFVSQAELARRAQSCSIVGRSPPPSRCRSSVAAEATAFGGVGGRHVIPVLTPEEMKAVDAAASEPVEALVERAGAAVARRALDLLGGSYGRRVTVVAGKGNNGAD